MDDTRFGIILLENPFMRREDLERCLQIQALCHHRKPIGQILLEEGLINERTLSLVLSIQERRRAFRRQAPEERAPEDPELPSPRRLLARARKWGASDLIFAESRRPRARVGGFLRDLSPERIDGEWMGRFLNIVLDGCRGDPFESRPVIETNLELGKGSRPRVVLCKDSLGPVVAIRLIPDEIPEADDLGLPPQVQGMLEAEKGLLLVAGGAGSGRTTTLASMAQSLVRDPDRGPLHMMVLDRHHEYRIDPGVSLLSAKKVGAEPGDLAVALRAAFREDVDVLVVGDLRGREAIELALQAAETGILVLAGMQAGGAVKAIRRLREVFPDNLDSFIRTHLASSLLGVLYQELVPVVDGEGVVLATEVLAGIPEVRNALELGDMDRLILLLTLAESKGCKSLDEALMDLVEDEKISMDEAFARARDRQRMLAATCQEEE